MSDENDESNREAEKNARSHSEPAQDVHQWLEDVHFATLSTISQVEGIEGFPIGSVAPLLSTLTENHTFSSLKLLHIPKIYFPLIK